MCRDENLWIVLEKLQPSSIIHLISDCPLQMRPSVLSCLQVSIQCYTNVFVELTTHLIDEETETLPKRDKIIWRNQESKPSLSDYFFGASGRWNSYLQDIFKLSGFVLSGNRKAFTVKRPKLVYPHDAETNSSLGHRTGVSDVWK